MMLEDLKDSFSQNEFTIRNTIKERMNYYNNNPEADKLTRARNKVVEVQGIML